MGALIAMQICEGVVLEVDVAGERFPYIFFGGFKGITSAFTIHGSVSRCCVSSPFIARIPAIWRRVS